MEVTKINTAILIKSLRSEGQVSQADYIELMQAKIDSSCIHDWSGLILTDLCYGLRSLRDVLTDKALINFYTDGTVKTVCNAKAEGSAGYFDDEGRLIISFE